MAAKSNEGLPVAISMVGGFLATLIVLFAGMANGTRPWILLLRAATTFLILSGFLKLLTAGVLQGIQWRRTPAPKRSLVSADDGGDSVHSIASSIRSTASNREGVA